MKRLRKKWRGDGEGVSHAKSRHLKRKGKLIAKRSRKANALLDKALETEVHG